MNKHNRDANDKKIFFYIYSLNIGGAERVLVTLVQKLIEEKDADVTIVTDVYSKSEYVLPDGIRRISLSDIMSNKGIYRSKTLAKMKALRSIVSLESPKSIVVFMAPLAIRTIIALFGKNVKIYSAIRSDPYFDYTTIAKRLVVKTIISQSTKIVCQTDGQKKFFGEENCVSILNPLASEFYTKPFEGIRDKIVLSTGRLYDYKNHIMLIEAFSSIASRYGEYKLVIIGEGPYRGNLEKRIVELAEEYPSDNLIERIILPGQSENIAKDIERATIFVLPSNTEGMPNSLIEAMALGLPCIATDCPCGGPRELIEDNKSGLLIPVGDKDRLVNAMMLLLDNVELRNRMGAEASLIKERCEIDKIAQKWKDVIYA